MSGTRQERSARASHPAGTTEPDLDVVVLSSLTLRLRRRFVLPWEELPDGTVRLWDGRDKTRVDRILRWGVVAFMWTVAALWFAGVAVAMYVGGPGSPGVLEAIFVGLGVLFCGVGYWFKRGARQRMIDIDLHGRVRVLGAGERPRGDDVGWSQGRLVLRPYTAVIHRDTLKGFTLLIDNGPSTVMLCVGEEKDECVRELERMPAQIASLPLVDTERVMFAADGLAFAVVQRMRQ